jgi:hypothetical protein
MQQLLLSEDTLKELDVWQIVNVGVCVGGMSFQSHVRGALLYTDYLDEYVLKEEVNVDLRWLSPGCRGRTSKR